MKSFKTLLLSSAVLAFGVSTASAEGFYISGGVGLSLPDLGKVVTPTGKQKLKMDDGYVADVAFGYAFSNNLRTELNFGYRKYDTNKIGATKIGGSLESYSFTANLLYDFVNKTNFTPFIGVGIGAANNKIRNKTDDIKSSSTELAALGTVGVAYNFTSDFSASLAYRLFATFDQKYGDSHYDMYANEFILGLRYNFGKPKAVASASGNYDYDNLPEYMVFFALNSATITPEAKKVLEKVAKEYKTNGDVKLKLTGHTDLTGPAAFNMELSKQRAISAKKVLVSLGIPANEIATKGVGMEDPLIPTALGVPELQNRRVVLDFD